MIKTIESLFLKYAQMKMALVVSMTFSSGRKLNAVIISASSEQNDLMVVSTDTEVPAHINHDLIEEWRDVTGKSTNLIDEGKAKEIYEKHISPIYHKKAHDGPQ